jgi:hypothetical protein
MFYFCWHDWSQWEDYKKFDGALYQQRRCLKCGKAKRRVTDPLT